MTRNRSYFEQIEALIEEEQLREKEAQKSQNCASLDDFLDAQESIDQALEELDHLLQ